MTISEDDFEANYRPIPKDEHGDVMRSWAELPDPAAHNVWTIVDCDGDLYAVAGVHYVNRLDYIITEKDWDDETVDAEWFISEKDDEEEE